MSFWDHIRELFKRKPRTAHHRLRRRVGISLAVVLVVDAFGTVLMWLADNGKPRSEIHNLWDAFFFSTVQLLTISSQMPNPVTTPGRVVDIFLELVGLGFVGAIAGSFANFYFKVEDDL
jgi:hypothetical protein